MERNALIEYASKVAHTLKDELPKTGVSMMITSDGEGAVVCHLMGRPDKFIEVLARTLASQDQFLEYMKLAVKGAELIKTIKKDLDTPVEIKDLSNN